MLIYGASGHGKVIASCLIDAHQDIHGFFDDGISSSMFFEKKCFGKYDAHVATDTKLVIAIGDNAIRSKVAQKVRHSYGTVIHPTAQVDQSVLIDEGTVVFHGAILQVSTQVGKHCIINTGASIDHDCLISDFVHIAPQVTLCGNIQVGKNTLIGANTVILPNLKIGENVIIGAGSVVTKDVPDNVVIAGNPAQIIRENER